MKPLPTSGRKILIVLILYVCKLGTVGAFESDPELNHMTLSGLTSLTVQVDGIHRDFKRFGLDPATIRQATTERLLASGIRVVDPDTAITDPETAFMRIKLNANRNQYNFFFYGVSIELKHKIGLNNPAGGYISGTIWRDGTTGVIMPTDLRKMNDVIAGLLSDFLADYRSQNRERLSAID